MPTYSVAEAKNRLPSLIDRALEGEEVIITRHGKPVAELRRAATPPKGDRAAVHDWFMSRSVKTRVPIDSLEILHRMREGDLDRVLGRQRSDPNPRRRTDKRGD